MRTITTTTDVYTFAELSEESKEKAIENYRNKGYEPDWQSENIDTLNKFAEIFPVKIKNWEYGSYRGDGVSFEFTADSDIEELTGQRLATYLWNNYKSYLYKGKYYSIHKNGKYYSRHSKIQLEHSCVLTGYCMDDDILQPIYDFMSKPDKRTDFKELMADCFHAWIKACNEDIEYQNSDEHIKEELEINNYEFTENGEII
jgi:hypothetical protein